MAAQAPALADATAIDNRQHVVGQIIDAAETQFEAFLWEDGVMRGLRTPVLRFRLAQDQRPRPGRRLGAGRAR